MVNLLKSVRFATLLGALAGVLLLTGCASRTSGLPELPQASGDAQFSTRYRIAPGDTIQIFVWRNPEVSTSVPVRPDGLLSAPLLEEVPAAGKTPAECALIEAWEEAGVKGKVTGGCMGLYSYFKDIPGQETLPCAVMVFPVKVSSLAESYPEAGMRRRKWMRPKKAALRVTEPELAQMLRGFNPRRLPR